jgi:hypothetical protein
MSALEFFKEFEQLIEDSSEDGQYKKVYIDVNLAIYSRVICAINELEALEKTIKRKDEHISELKEVHLLDQEVFNISKEAFYQLKLEKDKEIERLKAENISLQKSCELHYSLMISGERRGVDKGTQKAREIVMMLAKKARKRKRFCKARFYNDYKVYERIFRQAHKMLKDNQ